MGKTYRRLPSAAAMDMFLSRQGLSKEDVTHDEMKTYKVMLKKSKNRVSDLELREWKEDYAREMKRAKGSPRKEKQRFRKFTYVSKHEPFYTSKKRTQVLLPLDVNLSLKSYRVKKNVIQRVVEKVYKHKHQKYILFYSPLSRIEEEEEEDVYDISTLFESDYDDY